MKYWPLVWAGLFRRKARTILTHDLQDITKPLRNQQGHIGALVLEQGVGSYGRAVDQQVGTGQELLNCQAALLGHLYQTTADRQTRIRRCRRNFRFGCKSTLVDQYEIGARSSDIDAQPIGSVGSILLSPTRPSCRSTPP